MHYIQIFRILFSFLFLFRFSHFNNFFIFTQKKYFFQIGDILEFPLDLSMKPYYVPTNIQTSSAVTDNEKSFENVKITELNDNKIDKKLTKSIIKSKKSDYQLSSIVVHEGSADFGHYICYARPDPDASPDLWLKLNDQTVTETNFKNVCEISFGSKKSEKFSRNAYLLFYTRRI